MIFDDFVGYFVAYLFLNLFLIKMDFPFWWDYGSVPIIICLLFSAFVLLVAVVKVHESLFKFGWIKEASQ